MVSLDKRACGDGKSTPGLPPGPPQVTAGRESYATPTLRMGTGDGGRGAAGCRLVQTARGKEKLAVSL
ncbi:unnamed protein product [Arctogadus glacialis]